MVKIDLFVAKSQKEAIPFLENTHAIHLGVSTWLHAFCANLIMLVKPGLRKVWGEGIWDTGQNARVGQVA